MSQREKLIESIRNNPKDVGFDDACKVAEWLGFIHKGGKGAHRAFCPERRANPAQLSISQWSHTRISGAAIDRHDRQILGRAMTRSKRYPANIFWSDEDEGYVAVAPDLPGCSAVGDTEADAITELKTAIKGWIDAAKVAGNPIPQPSRPAVRPQYSGRFVARVPKELHAALAARAEAEGMSLNTYVVYALARACATEKAESKRKVAAKVGV